MYGGDKGGVVTLEWRELSGGGGTVVAVTGLQVKKMDRVLEKWPLTETRGSVEEFPWGVIHFS